MQRALERTEAPTGRYGHVGGRRWLIQVGPEVHLVTTDEELRELARRAHLTPDTPIYKVGAPQLLVDVPELALALTEVSESEPAVRIDRRSPERALLSEELAVLNRPLVDDVEYYDTVPRSGFRRAMGVLAILGLIAGGAYFALRFGPHLAEVVRSSLRTISAPAPTPPPASAPVPASPSAPAGPTKVVAEGREFEPEPPAPVAAPPEADPPTASPTAPRTSSARAANRGPHHHSRHRAR